MTSRLTAFIVIFAVLFLPDAAGAEVLTLEKALQIAMEKSSSMIRVYNNLEISKQNLKAQNASLKSQFLFEVTPFSLSKRMQYDPREKWYWNETRSSIASLNIGQRIKWTDAVLTLSNDLRWDESSSDLPWDSTTTLYQNNLYFTLSQPLFTYNQTQQALKELKLALEEAQLNYAIQKLEIERQVKRQFYGVYQKRMSLEIAREEYKNKEESYNIIKNKVDAGISAQEELFQAEVNFANSKATLQNSQVTYEDALDNFKILLGLPILDEIEVSADVRKSVVGVDLDMAVEKGLQYRMELRQKDIAIQYAKFDLTRTGAEDEFKASLDVSYGLVGRDNDFGDMYEDPIKSQVFMVKLNVPIWDWGKKKSRMKASEIKIDNRILSKEDEEKQIVLEIRQVYRTLQNQLNQIEIAEKSVENARLTYEINLERYKNGDISSKDIGEYQNQLSNEQLSHIAALINYRLALLDLKIASLWDFENDKPVLDMD